LTDLILRSRFSARILWIAFLAVMAVGVAGAPFRLAAQQAATASASQPAVHAEANGQAKPEAAKSEASDEKKFLLTPTVHSAAKALGLKDETMALVFEFINFAVIFLAIVIPLFRILPKFLRNRTAKLREDIESARKVTEDANTRLSAVEAKLASIGEEIARFRAEVEAESLQDEARIKATLEEEGTRILAAAEQEIGMAAAQARRTLRHFAADLAIDQATKQLVLTPETDRALIAEFVGDVAKGGLN
jgi:F-type H+-transporting ATPase subunit b